MEEESNSITKLSNKTLSLSLSLPLFLFGYSIFWHIQHNTTHNTWDMLTHPIFGIRRNNKVKRSETKRAKNITRNTNIVKKKKRRNKANTWKHTPTKNQFEHTPREQFCQ